VAQAATIDSIDFASHELSLIERFDSCFLRAQPGRLLH
jgi:hypothetical protein